MPLRIIPRAWPLLIALVALAGLYLATLQRDINGSGSPYMIDVGETQVALNLFGTLHSTGYPLYSFTGALLTASFRGVGLAGPAAAASLPSLIFMLAALGFLVALIDQRTGRPWLAALIALALGLTRSHWVHAVVAEVYAMAALFTVLMLWWVLKDERPWARRDWLIAALLLGLGIGHHRALAFIVPGLGLYLLPQMAAALKTRQRTSELAITLALGGLIAAAGIALSYVYLPLRAWMGGEWVYGSPDTWPGFWHEFTAREAGHLMQPPG